MRPVDDGDDGHYRYVGDDPVRVAVLSVGLERAREQLTDLASALAAVAPRVRSAWPLGAAGDAAVHDIGVTAAYVASAPAVLDGAARSLGVYADELTVARRRVDGLNLAYAVLAPAEAQLAALDHPSTAADLVRLDAAESDLAVARARAGYASTAQLDADYAAVVALVTGLRDECSAALDALTLGVSRVGSVRGASGYAADLDLVVGVGGGLASYLARRGLTRLPTDDDALVAFWRSLSSAERRDLLEADPARFGNLDGVPVADRDWANRRALAADLQAGRDLFAQAGLAVPTTPSDLDAELAGLTSAERAALAAAAPGGLGAAIGLFRNATCVARELAGAPSALLMTYDPRAFPKSGGPEGRAAIAYGDPDTADHVAVCVPGLESRVAKLSQVGSDARALAAEAAHRDPDEATAVVAWQGYDAPELPWTFVPGPGSLGILGDGQAEAGGALLAAAVHGLRATHEGSGGITVIGHSYGSTTTGLALQHHGLAADVDRVALIGSPGVGGEARTVAGLGLRDDQLYVGTASHDVINLTSDSLLGKNPLDPDFGGTRFEAESPDRGDSFAGIRDHSRYYSTAHGGSESLAALGDIVTGHGDRLAAEGLVAARPSHDRDPGPLAGPFGAPYRAPYDDPELHRTPTGGHF